MRDAIYILRSQGSAQAISSLVPIAFRARVHMSHWKSPAVLRLNFRLFSCLSSPNPVSINAQRHHSISVPFLFNRGHLRFGSLQFEEQNRKFVGGHRHRHFLSDPWRRSFLRLAAHRTASLLWQRIHRKFEVHHLRYFVSPKRKEENENERERARESERKRRNKWSSLNSRSPRVSNSKRKQALHKSTRGAPTLFLLAAAASTASADPPPAIVGSRPLDLPLLPTVANTASTLHAKSTRLFMR